MHINKEKIHVVIADSQFLITEALKSLLNSNPSFVLSAIVSSFTELTRIMENGFCDLLIADPFMPDFHGAVNLFKIKEKYGELPVLILTNTLNSKEFNECTKAGFRNIIFKTAGRDEILSAVEHTLKGRKYCSVEMMEMIFESSENRASVEGRLQQLTGSEIEIVRLIAGGLTTKEIAGKKNVSYHTVNTHRKNIFRKLEVTNVSELLIRAIKAGWIDNIEYYI